MNKFIVISTKIIHEAYAYRTRNPDPRTEDQYREIHISRTEKGISVSISGEISGLIEANKMKSADNLLVVEGSSVDRGYGPTLYDILLEVAGLEGKWVVADRHSISGAAYKVWQFYYLNRPDVEKIELDPGLWYLGRHVEEYIKNMTQDKSTWPDKREPCWALWHAYRKTKPTIIKKLRSKIRTK